MDGSPADCDELTATTTESEKKLLITALVSTGWLRAATSYFLRFTINVIITYIVKRREQ
uniref:Uncharacterized protein n=1 Tax=Oryza sativa subsp. japonica TaxID=39947 RepID=Q67WY5_ORYSJ|nr:hypothetical protein [Oryza sativa Japonica Group]